MKPVLALPLQQHPQHASALRLMGRSVASIAIPNAAPLVAVRQFGQLMTSRGPIWRHGTNNTQKADALRQSGLRLINADTLDNDALKTAGFRRLMTPAHVAELDLTGTPNTRVSTMKPKWRNAWRASGPLHISEQRFDLHTHTWVLQADLEQQRSKGFRGLPHQLVKAYATCDPKAVQVVIANEHDAPVAAMIFVMHKPVVTYHIGWTSSRGRSVCAHHQIITEAANRFSKRGFTRLDLGTVDTVNTPGLARFKIGCGAQVRALGGTWLRMPGG